MNAAVLSQIQTCLGTLGFSATVWTTWLIMLVMVVFSALATRRLEQTPGKLQAALEGAITAMYGAIESVLEKRAPLVFAFISTLWLFLIVANLAGIIPGLKSPTADLSATSALAVVVFLSVHWFGIKSEGWKSYIHHYFAPTPIMLPFHIISEISRTIALAVRLFGNMMSLDMAAMMILLVAGFLIPVPLMMLHIVEALVQAYIFGMLSLIFIASGIESQRHRQEPVKMEVTNRESQ
jgi:F-type H+-transporting ATPase subunit a